MKKKTICDSELCPVKVAIDTIGGKWDLEIIWTLNQKSYRFGELRRQIGSISEKILIQQLKHLVQTGLVQRIQYPEVPPRVEYSLTEKGKSLLPIFDKIHKWSEEHLMSDYFSKKEAHTL